MAVDSSVANAVGGVVLIGGAGGIGSETAERLLASNRSVMIAGRRSEQNRSFSARVNADFFELDAREPEQVEACLKQAKEHWGSVAGVVNLVGSVLLKPAHLTSEQDWDDTIATNLRSAFATVRGAAKIMRGDGGSIVLMASAVAESGFANHEAIAAAKAGVLGLMRSAAATYASSGLRFNAVAPGLTKTPMTEAIWSSPASAKISEAMHPLGRLGEPGDIASAICWLLDPANTWVTGQAITVDGGLSELHPPPRRTAGS